MPWPGKVESAGELVRLHAHQRDQAEAAVAAEPPHQPGGVDSGVGLVDRLDVDGDARAERAAFRAVRRDAVEAASEFDGMMDRHQPIT